MNEETLLALTQEQAQSLVNYLQTKPYGEVHGFIAMLLKCPTVKVEPKPKQKNEPANPGNTTEG